MFGRTFKIFDFRFPIQILKGDFNSSILVHVLWYRIDCQVFEACLLEQPFFMSISSGSGYIFGAYESETIWAMLK
jgi:hypothetical protein